MAEKDKKSKTGNSKTKSKLRTAELKDTKQLKKVIAGRKKVGSACSDVGTISHSGGCGGCSGD